MNTIKLAGIELGFSNDMKKYNLLDKMVKILDIHKNSMLIENNIPIDDAMEYLKNNNMTVGYYYHQNDKHEFALIKINNEEQEVLDRVIVDFTFIDDEEDVYLIVRVDSKNKDEYITTMKIKTLEEQEISDILFS